MDVHSQMPILFVSNDWLAPQIEFRDDAVCGTVEVDSWSDHGDLVRSKYIELYQFIENHRHIHGASLGLSADAYRNEWVPASHCTRRRPFGC